MCAASNNHSPKRCKILLHFGRSAAGGIRFSRFSDTIATKEVIIGTGHSIFGIKHTEIVRKTKTKKEFEHLQAKFDAELGPELGVSTDCVTLDERELVNPISEPFDRPMDIIAHNIQLDFIRLCVALDKQKKNKIFVQKHKIEKACKE